MSAKSLMRIVLLAIVSLGILADCVRADKLQLQEKLSKEINVQLNDVAIAEALERIGQTAGVKFALSEEAVWKLPQGEATRLSVTLQGPLADSMTEMLNAFLMRYAVGDEKITIYPRPELEHILSRPTTKQLELLKKMHTMVLTLSAGSPGGIVKRMISECFNAVILPVDRYSGLSTVMTRLVEGLPDGTSSPGMTLPQLLESVGPAWYVSGPDFPNQPCEIWIVSESDFREAKLNQIVDISFKDETADAIIQRLANWTGMELLVEKKEASWLNEKISVEMQNVKLRQALRNVVGTVDGHISIAASRKEIRVLGPLHARKLAVPIATKTQSGDYVGKISIPMDGGRYYIEFMLREQDLTEELRRLWKERMTAILKGPHLYQVDPASGKPEPVKKPAK